MITSLKGQVKSLLSGSEWALHGGGLKAILECNVEIMAAGCVGEALYLALRISQLAPSADFPNIWKSWGEGWGGQVQTLKKTNTAL